MLKKVNESAIISAKPNELTRSTKAGPSSMRNPESQRPANSLSVANREAKPISAPRPNGGATHLLKPSAGTPRQPLPGRHIECETHGIPATESQTRRRTQPTLDTSGSISADHASTETQSRNVRTRRSIPATEPNHLASGAPISIGSDADCGAIVQAKPSEAPPRNSIGDQSACETQADSVANEEGGGQTSCETHNGPAAPDLIPIIRELWKRRQSWHRAEKSLTLQAFGVCLRYSARDKTAAGKLLKKIEGGNVEEEAYMACFPILNARVGLKENRTGIEKALKKYAKGLDIAPWFVSVPGVSILSLAALVGECGDIGSYKSVSALWKRMGVAVIDGGRQRRVSGADALLHGYSPQRRSVLWNIGSGLVGGMGKGPRPIVGEDTDARDDLSKYQKLFIREMRKWALKDEAHRKEPVEKDGVLKESFSLHAANHARRIVSKEFLKDLFLEWTRAA